MDHIFTIQEVRIRRGRPFSDLHFWIGELAPEVISWLESTTGFYAGWVEVDARWYFSLSSARPTSFAVVTWMTPTLRELQDGK